MTKSQAYLSVPLFFTSRRIGKLESQMTDMQRTLSELTSFLKSQSNTARQPSSIDHSPSSNEVSRGIHRMPLNESHHLAESSMVRSVPKYRHRSTERIDPPPHGPQPQPNDTSSATRSHRRRVESPIDIQAIEAMDTPPSSLRCQHRPASPLPRSTWLFTVD
jgi:hypothetical protein